MYSVHLDLEDAIFIEGVGNSTADWSRQQAKLYALVFFQLHQVDAINELVHPSHEEQNTKWIIFTEYPQRGKYTF